MSAQATKTKGKATTRWLRCAVKKGMFSNEAIVEISDKEYIVPKELTRENPASVMVTVKRSKKPGKYLALLPTEYTELVQVGSDQLVGS